MIRAGRALLMALALCLAPLPTSAQAASVLLSEGVKAYRDVQFAAAVELLQRALAGAGLRALSPIERVRALIYLGASQEFLDDRNAAVASFRALMFLEPRFRPDSVVLPPRVTQLFAEVLQTTKAAALVAPAEARFFAGSDAFAVRVYVTSRHEIDARVVSAGGGTVVVLYRGTVEDSVRLSWNGLDSAGEVAASGSYRLAVASKLSQDQVLRTVWLPFDLTVQPLDTMPWPKAPPRPRSGWDVRFLVPGAVLGLGLALPAAFDGGGARGARFTLGLAFGTIGVLGGRPGTRARPAPTVAEWRRRVSAVQRENARRRGKIEIMLKTGAPERSEGAER